MPKLRNLAEIVSGPSNRKSGSKSAGMVECKAFIVKSVDVENHRISAIASTGSVDRDGDIILPSAFKKSLPGYMENPVILACHKHSLADGRSPVVASVIESKINNKGLHIIIEFEHETELGLEYWTLYSKKRMRAFSVGFIPLKWRDESKDGRSVRIYTEVELLEISCVPVPSNREALSKSAKKKADWLAGKRQERAGGIQLTVDEENEILEKLRREDPLFDQKAVDFAEALLGDDVSYPETPAKSRATKLEKLRITLEEVEEMKQAGKLSRREKKSLNEAWDEYHKMSSNQANSKRKQSKRKSLVDLVCGKHSDRKRKSLSDLVLSK